MSDPFKPLTAERIEELRREWDECWTPTDEEFYTLMDMAAASLSLPAPCGHPSQYVYSEDGGAHMVCLLCERSARPEALHTDHPLRHWDRTCPACIADKVPTKANVVYCYQQIRDCLKELLRLYDWRNEIGAIERDFNHDKKQVSRWLNQYGREKKQAWFVARELLTGGRKTPDFSEETIPSPQLRSQEEK